MQNTKFLSPTIKLITQQILSWISILFIINPFFGQTPDNWVYKLEHDPFGHQHIKAIVPLADSTLWVFCSKGVYAIDNYLDKPQKLSNLNLSMPLDVDKDKVIAYSSKDTIFIATLDDFKKGKYSKTYTFTYRELPSCLQRRAERVLIRCIKFDESGQYIWIGTEKHGAIRIGKPNFTQNYWYPNPERFFWCEKKEFSTPGILSNEVRSIHIDNQNRAWIAFERGLSIVDNKKCLEIFNGYIVQSIRELEKSKTMWLLVNGVKNLGNQLIMVNYENMETIVQQCKKSVPLAEFKNALITDVLIDHDGDFWGVSTNTLFRRKEIGKALSPEDLNNKILESKSQYFSYTEKLIGTPYCIEEDRRGVIWIGTRGDGLYYLEKVPGLELEFIDSIRCHGEKNSRFKITAMEGKSPYRLSWTSRNNGDGISRPFKDTIFSNIGRDTFLFKLEDLNDDVGFMEVIVDDPKPLSAKINEAARKKPTYEDMANGIIELHEIKGGRRFEGYNTYYQGYKVGLEDPTKSKPDTSKLMGVIEKHLGIGKFILHVVDRSGCLFTIHDSFPKPERFFRFESDCVKNINKEYKTNRITFSDHDHNLSGDAFGVLDELLGLLNVCPQLRLDITGYVQLGKFNQKPGGDTATELSTKRAREAARYLIDKGVAKERISAHGAGAYPYENKVKPVIFKFTY